MSASEQNKPEPPPRQWNMQALALFGLILASILALVISDMMEPGAPRPVRADITHDAPRKQTFILDEDYLLYSWIDVKKGALSARSLDRVPRAKRAAVQIWSETWPHRHPDLVYIADLTDASPGESASATLRSRRYLHAATHAGDMGEVHGVLTAFLAGEIAAFDPSSDRQKGSRQAAKFFEGVEARRAPTFDEIYDQMRRRRLANQRALLEAQKLQKEKERSGQVKGNVPRETSPDAPAESPPETTPNPPSRETSQ